MVEHTPILVCRPRPYPDESLLSYLLRVQSANGYPRLSWLTIWLRDTKGVPIPNRLLTTNSVPFLENLAATVAIPVPDLYAMTLNRYASVLALPGTPLLQAALSSGETVPLCLKTNRRGRWSRADDATAFCPVCLHGTRFHRLQWLLFPVFACTDHANWLRDTCATCGERVSIPAVVSGQCAHCGAELADMPTVPLNTEGIQVQVELMRCLQPCTVLDSLYPPLSAQAVFRLLDGLCAATRGLGWTGEGCYQPDGVIQQPFPSSSNAVMSTTQYGSLYISAWQALTNWPTNFYHFLDCYRRRPGAGQSGVSQILGHFYGVWLERCWRHPDMEPVQAAFNEYFVSHLPPSREIRRLNRVQRYPELRDRFQFMDVRNAARSLGVSPPMIQRLVRDGYVRVSPQHEANRPGYFVYRDDLKDVLEREPACVPFKAVAAECSVSAPAVREWMSVGLLFQTGVRQLYGLPQAVLTRRDVDAFRRRLARCVHTRVEREVNAVSLRETCIRNGKVGMTSAQVLQRVLDGKLQAFHTDPDLKPFGDLWFDPAEVAALTEQVKAEHNWMGFLEVWRLLGVSRELVHLWIARQLLAPVATFARATYFDRDVVKAFHARLLRSDAVAQWLETNRSALSMWVRAGYLPVLSGMGRGQGKGYNFDREAIARWHTQYVTAGELRRVLGPTHYTAFLKRVRLGNYAVAIGVEQRFYHRADLEHFQATLEQEL